MEALYNGFKKVWKAKGAAGIDGQSLSDYASNLRGNLEQLLLELREKRYRLLPVKRVEIDKDDGGKRLLGIPAVRDRIVQQALLDILTPIFDPDFHPSNYGYRPNRSCHQAITKATLFTHIAHSDDGVKFLGVEIYGTPITSVQILDFYHVSEYVSDAAEAIYPGKKLKNKRREWLKNTLHGPFPGFEVVKFIES